MKTQGWILIGVAFFVMCGDIAIDVAKIKDWSEVFQPAFISSTLAHFSAVGIAALGGKLLPGPGGE